MHHRVHICTLRRTHVEGANVSSVELALAPRGRMQVLAHANVEGVLCDKGVTGGEASTCMWVAMYQETNEVAVLSCIWSVSGIWGSVVGVCGSLGTPVIRVHPPLAAPEWALPGSEGASRGCAPPEHFSPRRGTRQRSLWRVTSLRPCGRSLDKQRRSRKSTTAASADGGSHSVSRRLSRRRPTSRPAAAEK